MGASNADSLAVFLNKKQSFISVLETAMQAILEDMGENAKGIEWFSSVAEQLNEELSQKAA